jgi:hypothetical protein
MKRDNWEVQDEGIRPAGPPTECFYCHAQREAQHNANCVIRERTVVVDVTVRLVITQPEHWTAKQIEWHMNEGSWCADNILEEMEAQAVRMGCLCNTTTTKFVREASSEDEETHKVFVKDLTS